MTEEQVEQFRKLKAETAAFLRSVDIGKYNDCIGGTDQRLSMYIGSVITSPEDHNTYELLSVKRYLHMFDTYEFRKREVRKFYKFYELLKFSGQNGRQRYKLTPVQCFQYANIFGFWNEDKRVIREVCLFVPRKFSKTTSTASLMLWDLLMGASNSQAFAGSNSYDQSKILFNEVRKCLLGIDGKQKYFKVNREMITFKGGGRESMAQCLTSKSSTKDGLNASFVAMDEFSQATDASLLTVLTTSMGMRKNPLTVIITTASDLIDGPFAVMLDGYKAVLRGEIEDDSVFPHLFMPDPWDDEGDPHTWQKVQPHLGITVTEDFYQREWAKAKRDAVNMLAFRTKLLNVFAQNEQSAWIGASIAREAMRKIDIRNVKGRPDTMCAIDLSESDDFSAVSFAIYQNTNLYFYTAYFFPSGALKGHRNEAMYRVWAEQGHLILTEGEVIDYKRIVQYILDMNKYLCIIGIGYDQWKSLEVINMLSASGAQNVLKAVGQTYGSFTAPVQAFEHGIKTGHIFMNDNPINAYCFGNAILDEDGMENKKPIKRSRFMKIDGVITKLMCLRLFIDYER